MIDRVVQLSVLYFLHQLWQGEQGLTIIILTVSKEMAYLTLESFSDFLCPLFAGTQQQLLLGLENGKDGQYQLRYFAVEH